MRVFKVEDIRPGEPDFAGFQVLCVYMFNPPDYAVYRTPARVMVQFADDKSVARRQRTCISPLTPLRGQINALIDGWHTSGVKRTGPVAEERDPLRELTKQKKNQNRKRADRYDRRVADAICTGLENDVPTALALLAQVKNDIISERTSMARIDYLLTAFGMAAVIILLMSLFVHWEWVFIPPVGTVWTAVAGGTIGAFFSIAIGLKGRAIQIDLQNRDNIADAVLRIWIGAIAGGVLICLLLSELVKTSALPTARLTIDHPNSAIAVFTVGFFAGFFERLVPDLLSRTNLGTKESASGPPGETPHTPAPPAAPLPPSNGNDRSATPAGVGERTQEDDGGDDLAEPVALDTPGETETAAG